jgi:hypothetical protein
MPGPFTSYVPPGAYTRTLFEPAVNTLIDSIRLPVFIGIGEETLTRTDYEMFRGSSAVTDNLVTKEDVSSQWVTAEANPSSPTLGSNDGTLRKFRVDNYPIVTGDGSGTTTTTPSDVTVLVDGVQAEVSQVNGTLGTVTLKSFPSASATVTCTYYYNRSDTQFTDDVSDQGDGSNTVFKVFNTPIVDGTNGGVTSTSTSDVTVTVDGVAATVSAIDGAAGTVTLASAPASNAVVLVTYYHNTWQNTFDLLPDTGIVETLRVGLSPGDSTYIEETDYIIKNQSDGPSIIHWGASYRVASGVHTDGAEYFDDTQVTATLVDTKVYLDETSAYVDPDTSVASSTVFRLTYVPTLGNGRDTTLGSDTFNAVANGRIDHVTDRPDLITAYVGADVVDAMSRPAVTVLKVDGSNRLITLGTAVQPNETVYATYWTNFLQDDTYTMTAVTAGASGTGTYTVQSELLNDSLYQAKFIQKTALSQTLNWGTGSQTLMGIFHDGSGVPVEEYVELTINQESARGATLKTSVAGPWAIKSGTNDTISINGTSVSVTPSTPATVTSSNSETFDLDGLIFYVRSNQATSLTQVTFVGNGLSAAQVAAQINGALRTSGSVSSTASTGSTGVVPGADTGLTATASSGRVVLTSEDVGSDAQVVIGSGDSNTVLGFSAGTTTGTSTTPADLRDDINGTVSDVTATVDGSHVVITTDDTGPTETLTLNAVANDAYTTLGFQAGQTDQGEAAYYTYTVDSYLDDAFSLANTSGSGTGTSNTGTVGQTYIDEVTGLRISLLMPEEASIYDDEGTIRFSVLSTFVTDSASPVYAMLGTEVKVKNTTDVGVGDTVTLETFDKAGSEPSVGDVYYASYTYSKTNYDAKVFTKFSDIEAEYGTLNAQNRLTLAMFLAISNGALLVAGKQVVKETGGTDATATSYMEAIDSLRKPIERRFRPAVIVPVTTDQTVISFAKTHCTVQSSPRWRNERICIFGYAQGTTPVQAQSYATSLASQRMWAIYPDSAVVTLTDENGTETESIVDGSFLAAAVAGSNVSTAYDVASPMTFRQIVGFTRLIREMDEVEKNQTAVAGITVLEDLDPNIRIRQAFTTDMSSSLKREPTVITIADHVQQVMRSSLSQFIGVKYLGGVLGDIERVVKTTMRGLVQAEIIANFSNVRAEPDETDPTAVQVSLVYVPVFPLNYVVVTFNLRSR